MVFGFWYVVFGYLLCIVSSFYFFRYTFNSTAEYLPMNISTPCSRRILVKSSVFGLLAAAVPNIVHARTMAGLEEDRSPALRDERYPAVSHFDLAKLKELVDTRQELAKASWDWGFGDWETAIGAASHVGRKDIAAYL